MTQNAKERLDAIPSTKISWKNKEEETAMANGKFMFNIDHKLMSGLGSNSVKRAISKAKDIYVNIEKAMSRMLVATTTTPEGSTTFDLQHAYLFCGGKAFEKGPVPHSAYLSDVWHAPVDVDGTNVYLVPADSQLMDSPKPCTEVGKKSFVGKTIQTSRVTKQGDAPAVLQTYVGVILCPGEGHKAKLPKDYVVDEPST
ncbi:hypothetical protein ONS96_008529 [Cadophora gregata f. sp. sojae]|nr:hypothetical protein ONS96_008529 [Cadophora gregata f. sp. sojae]